MSAHIIGLLINRLTQSTVN